MPPQPAPQPMPIMGGGGGGSLPPHVSPLIRFRKFRHKVRFSPADKVSPGRLLDRVTVARSRLGQRNALASPAPSGRVAHRGQWFNPRPMPALPNREGAMVAPSSNGSGGTIGGGVVFTRPGMSDAAIAPIEGDAITAGDRPNETLFMVLAVGIVVFVIYYLGRK